MLNLYRNINEALTEYPIAVTNTQYVRRGIQLLPNNERKYVQQTSTVGGCILEDWRVYVVDCKGTKSEVTSYFLVEKIVNASDGSPQIVWSLLNVPFDFGWNMVYLQVEQTSGETFYSNPFMLTDFQAYNVVQLHYKKEKNDDYLSVGVTMYYDDSNKKSELKTYYEIATKLTVAYAVKVSKYDTYSTTWMQKSILIALSDILEYPYVYLNGIRCYLYEAMDIPPKKGDANYSQAKVMLSKNTKDTFSGTADYLDIDYGNLDYSV